MANKMVLQRKMMEKEGVAVLTLDRPEKKNALSKELLLEILAALEDIKDNDNVRCVLTTGSGDSFSSGLDLYDLRNSWTRRRKWHEESTVQKIISLMRLMPRAI